LHRSGDYKPGEWIAEKNAAFVKAFTYDEFFGNCYSHVDLKFDLFDGFADLQPATFNNMARRIADSSIGGRAGLKLNPARYEPELAAALKTPEGSGKNFIATLEGVQAVYKTRNKGEYKRRAGKNEAGALITVASFTDGAHWQWSCKPGGPYDVRAVDFTVGYGDWNYRDLTRMSGRACFAELKL